MEQAKYAPCPACQAPIPVGHKFCGRCGETTPADLAELRTNFFGDLQDPSKASLVVIRGEGLEGLSYHLRASEHTLGRKGQIQLDDPFASERHANLYYRGTALQLRDENPRSGTFVRIRDKAKLAMGDLFVAGDQLFRIEPMPTLADEADATGTFFYASPTFSSPFRVVQLLEGGSPGLTCCPRQGRVSIGRQGCDMNILSDTFLSTEHCTLEQDADGFSLVDNDSQNGTYARVKGEQTVTHGDYFLIGRKVMRVEFNA